MFAATKKQLYRVLDESRSEQRCCGLLLAAGQGLRC
jgi:hypothetical protein